MSVLSPFNSPPATDTQQAVNRAKKVYLDSFYEKDKKHTRRQPCSENNKSVLIVFAWVLTSLAFTSA